ncbi:MAG: GMC family oxidoreductase N-terminal domain-containing protein [Desulfosudis oleivorans]|nr:GMC family oxidoreductase N-terminal domain-containing protein [Desulfosudis oleivorans]
MPKAVAAGIELIPNCQVDRVAEGVVYATVTKAPAGTKPGSWPEGAVEVKAKRVVLAGGTAGSPAILLRSGLAAELPTLGRYITVHPALTVYGIYPEPIKNYKGFPKTYFTPKFSESHHHYIETAFYYPFVSTKHLGSWGASLRDAMKKYHQFMCMIILNHDAARPESRIELDRKGMPKIVYTAAPETIAALCHAQAQAARIIFAAGREKAIMPCADHPIFGREVPDARLEEFIKPANYVSIKMPLASAHLAGRVPDGQRAGRFGDRLLRESAWPRLALRGRRQPLPAVVPRQPLPDDHGAGRPGGRTGDEDDGLALGAVREDVGPPPFLVDGFRRQPRCDSHLLSYPNPTGTAREPEPTLSIWAQKYIDGLIGLRYTSERGWRMGFTVDVSSSVDDFPAE